MTITYSCSLFSIQVLSETTKKAENHSREKFVSETTLSQVRLILVDAERRRGRAYFETDPASAQAPSMLVHTLEQCVQEMIKDVEVKTARINEVPATCLLSLSDYLITHCAWGCILLCDIDTSYKHGLHLMFFVM